MIRLCRPPPATQTGAGPSPESAISGAPPPVATITIPPIVQNTPQGGFVFTPGKVVTTPAAVLPPSTVGPPPGPPPPPRGPRKFGPSVSAGGSALNPAGPLPPPAPLHPDEGITGALNDEKNLTRDFGKAIQAALCVEPTGDFGSATRDAIQSWRSIKRSTVSGPLSPKEISDLLGLPACDRTLYRSPFEQTQYPSELRVKVLQSALAKALGKSPPDRPSGKLDEETRIDIIAFQKLSGLPQTGIMTASVQAAILKKLNELSRK
jgi:peptidoglycan hydrolase-like protein with peptidoglycan-binding domain